MTDVFRVVTGWFVGIALGLASHSLSAGETNTLPQVYLPRDAPAAAHISDLVLIYQGGTHRPAWTSEQFSPYVTFRDPHSRKEAWLFDGFLFIEFVDGRGNQFADGYRQKPATKADWQWLMDRNFEGGVGLKALEQELEAARRRLGAPPSRRKVVLSLPEPIRAQKNWGECNGRTLDFDNPEDRVAACEWYVATVAQRWKDWAPKQLDLAGFYWIAENAASAKAILPRIKLAVQAQGRKFFWIPYWQATGAKDWRQLGFDAAYQQPNHFFNTNVLDDRLDAACAFARTNGLGLEFECDARASAPQTAAAFSPRLHAYLDRFEQNGARTNAAMAYYEGGGALGRMANSTEPEVRALYEAVARWVVSRQQP